MEQRTFQIDEQWSAIYYPEQPSGFSVMVIGDRGHFVGKDTSFWLQNPGRLRIIEHLKGYGYTLFTSNYGANWGSPKAVELAEKLYIYFMKNEISNQRFHILAEGTGALTALKLAEELGDQVRSIVFVNPCLSLKEQLNKEKNNKFFYEKWLEEVALEYGMESKECEKFIIESKKMPDIPKEIPVKIIHILGSLRDNQSSFYRKLQQKLGSSSLHLSYLLPEKRYKIPYLINKFFKEHEKPL
ncbi:lipase family protein [Bacillus massiliglaciei]|uniref:hydrolase n=1 Tax=Bacillus massiliglaciei TaxID=1816693 RepID=UPI000A6D82C9|nr:hydrolase [Bacillus massiliglaciei]